MCFEPCHLLEIFHLRLLITERARSIRSYTLESRDSWVGHLGRGRLTENLRSDNGRGSHLGNPAFAVTQWLLILVCPCR